MSRKKGRIPEFTRVRRDGSVKAGTPATRPTGPRQTVKPRSTSAKSGRRGS